MAKTTVELPEVIHRKLRVKAALENSSMNEVVVEALKRHLHNLRIEPGVPDIDSVAKVNQTQTVSSKEG
jgi:hypothetical protein